jgi:hypothetical protein
MGIEGAAIATVATDVAKAGGLAYLLHWRGHLSLLPTVRPTIGAIVAAAGMVLMMALSRSFGLIGTVVAGALTYLALALGLDVLDQRFLGSVARALGAMIRPRSTR